MTIKARLLPLFPSPYRAFCSLLLSLLLSLFLPLFCAAALTVSVSGCTQTYYSAMEKVGQHKRDILRSRSEARAEDVRERIDSIERVAADFFEEWEQEIELLQNPSYRADSQRSLRDSRGRYAQLINAMKRAESKMPPVLDAFRDQVLFLKHSLNARAVAALEGTLVEIESDVASLIRDIGVSIKEAESFLSQLES